MSKMQVKAELIKERRAKTNAGFLDCKNALVQTSCDMDKAVDVLRKQGLALADKKKERKTAEGIVASYIHLGGKIGVLVEVNCETDFVARNDVFKDFVKDITMQIAARDPGYLTRDDVEEDELEREREIYRAQMKDKPAHILDKIVEGKLKKFYSERCLMEQPFIKNPDITVIEYAKQKIAELGENIVIRRFIRYAVGEDA